MLLPYLLAYVIDTIVPTKDIQRIVVYGLIMIAVSIAGWIFDIKANRLASRVARDATIHIRHDPVSYTHLGDSSFLSDQYKPGIDL